MPCFQSGHLYPLISTSNTLDAFPIVSIKFPLIGDVIQEKDTKHKVAGIFKAKPPIFILLHCSDFCNLELKSEQAGFHYGTTKHTNK